MSEPMTEERLAELREDCARIWANDWYGPPTYNDNVTLDCVAEIDRLRAELAKHLPKTHAPTLRYYGANRPEDPWMLKGYACLRAGPLPASETPTCTQCQRALASGRRKWVEEAKGFAFLEHIAMESMRRDADDHSI